MFGPSSFAQHAIKECDMRRALELLLQAQPIGGWRVSPGSQGILTHMEGATGSAKAPMVI